MKLWSPLILLLTAALAAPLHAQCPDGTPPPCSQLRPPVRPAVPMDARTWIVLPFDNQKRAADLDWLKDASASLLYTSLSGWSDVHAVDDKRVADFLREVPTARAGSKLSLGDAQTVARRAGAGKLVMGDFLKLGGRTLVSATAYDARTGIALRSVHEQTAVEDSLLPLFGRIARGLLGVPALAAGMGTVGTSRADAYKEYLAGVAALNRFDVAEAKQRLTSALVLDSGFALAHYKLAITSIYDEAARNARRAAQPSAGMFADLKARATAAAAAQAEREKSITAAARLSGPLPARERDLINGLLAQTKKDYARACELYGRLVRADSSDVEALYGVGECTYSDDAIEFSGGDSTRPRFRTSWNTTLRVLRRALSVDPSYHLAFDRVLAVLTASYRVGCRRVDPAVACGPDFPASVRWDGDSLLTVPVRAKTGDVLAMMRMNIDRSTTRRLNLEQARIAAEQWVAAGPGEGRAHKTLGQVLLALGCLEAADREIAEAAGLLPFDEYSDLPSYRLEIALKRGYSAEALRLYDSLVASVKAPAFRRDAIMGFAVLTGRAAQADSVIAAMYSSPSRTFPAAILGYLFQTSRIVLGTAGDSALALERQVRAIAGVQRSCDQSCQVVFGASWMFGLRTPHRAWLAFDSTVTDLRLAPAAAMAAGDTARLRAAARSLDSLSHDNAALGLAEDGTTAVAADAFLLVGDTVAALRMVRRLLDTTLVLTPLQTTVGGISVVGIGALWPREMLLRADLAAARGQSQEARVWYQRFLDLWAKADPEFAPLLARVRKSVNGQQ